MSDHLESITLKNWLSYKKQIFKFHPGVNMIIGPSDHGKSAMMDAILKVLENRPMGDDFQSWWGGKTLVSLKFAEAIVRYKKDDKAQYQIKNRETEKTTIFTAFGTSVPQEISDVLRINRKINVQKQLEKKAPIFLLSENSGDIARHLNEVANLGGIDKALANGKADLGKDLMEKKRLEKAIKDKEKELIKFTKLDQLKQLIIHAEKLQNRIDTYQEIMESLEQGLNKVDQIRAKITKIRKKLKIMPKVEQALNLIDTHEKIEQEQKTFLTRLGKISKYQKRLNWIQHALKGMPLVNRGLALVQIIDKNQEDIDKVEGKWAEIIYGLKRKGVIKKQLKKERALFKSRFPDICPLCNSAVEKEKV